VWVLLVGCVWVCLGVVCGWLGWGGCGCGWRGVVGFLGWGWWYLFVSAANMHHQISIFCFTQYLRPIFFEKFRSKMLYLFPEFRHQSFVLLWGYCRDLERFFLRTGNPPQQKKSQPLKLLALPIFLIFS